VQVVLTTEDLYQIEDAAAQMEIQGARYPEQFQKLVDR
jgi:hypothetical protein